MTLALVLSPKFSLRKGLCQAVMVHGPSDPQHPQGADPVPLHPNHWEKETEIFPDNGESRGFEEAGMDVTPTPSKFQPPPRGVLVQSHSGSPHIPCKGGCGEI